MVLERQREKGRERERNIVWEDKNTTLNKLIGTPSHL